MVRTKSSGPHRKESHKKVLQQAKGFRGRASKAYRVAKQSVVRAQQYSYIHRKKRPNDFRRLWIMRLNAYLRKNGAKYSVFIGQLNRMIQSGEMKPIDRKTLSEAAIRAPHILDDIIKKTQAKA